MTVAVQTERAEVKKSLSKFYTFSDHEKEMITLALVTYKETVKGILSTKEEETLKNLIRIFVYRDVV